MTAVDALQAWAADWGLGGAVNQLDDLTKMHGRDSVPETVLDAGAALLEALEALHLDTSAAPRAADVWRAEP